MDVKWKTSAQFLERLSHGDRDKCRLVVLIVVVCGQTWGQELLICRDSVISISVKIEIETETLVLAIVLI